MKTQKSFESTEKGTVYIVPTPIGNLEDITFRALKVMESASLIAAEDTRNTKKLLTHFDIHTQLISYHDHNKESRGEQLLERLEAGDSIAFVSDAGMPGISDPGYEMVQAAVKADIPVVVLPGANAAVCALIGSGLATDEFLFYGFLPRKKKDRLKELERLKPMRPSLLFYESPYRLKETVSAIYEQLGDRQITLARELTKRFEEYIRGTVSEIMEWTKQTELKGEFCVVVEGNKEDSISTEELWWSHLSVVEHVNYYMENESNPSKDAIKKVATERQMPKREVYQQYHIE
ncbi:16S rRNA (cytidine(1402)-2'-O)-methyltransferase [Virgibacillus phasianinus]|uniref:Ribosomal RNA small subunit methyltransferase I n=1 Tax=Virgibacillus phasianinus TaxID=2017483 RepID=A0A220U131_9BACI|nr:16S rRNA (cytidine(1402)-2'-O)-methyltransferase [Virgibacillus phasianinus]ASK61725.1 16S rRNA (cytidine(1402)-2'-O)-methyltransferase [Virgibacillus phasianinus]